MKTVPVWVAPVDIVQIEALGIPLNSLFHRCPESDEVIHRLIGSQQPVVLDIFQLLDGRLDVLLAEEILAPLVPDAVDLLELAAQDVFEQDIRSPLLPFAERLGRCKVFIAQPCQNLQSRNLGQILFICLKITHFCYPFVDQA